MSMTTNDWIWIRLSNRYGVTAPTYQVGDVFARWLAENNGSWGYSLVDFYASKNAAGTTFGDGAFNYWSGGALSAASFWLDASSANTSTTDVPNLGSGGSALNARYGAVSGVDAADPVLLTHTGTNYLYLPGIASNYASTASSTALNISADIEIVCRVALTDWTPATENMLVSRWDSPSSQRCFILRISTSGVPYLTWSADGITGFSAIPSGGPAFVDGTTYWLKATLDVDNGAAGSTVRYYYAADSATEPTVWTQWGADVVTAGVTSLFASSSAVLEVGTFNTGVSGAASGKFYRALVRNGIGGSTVFDANFTTGITSGSQTTFTESSVNAATVTINRAVSGRKSVAVVRPVWLFGTDDYMEVAANPFDTYVTTTTASTSGISTTHTQFDAGTATSGGAAVLDDTAKIWTVNQYLNRAVRITGGTGSGQVRVISTNTATQLTVSPAWTTIPDATSTYVIESLGNVEGDIQIIVRCALDNWATGLIQPFVEKRAAALGQSSYYFYINATGIPGFTYTTDGSTSITVAGATVVPFTNGTAYWLRVRRTASTGAWQFDYAADQTTEPSVWTSLSSGTGTAGLIWKGTADITIAGSIRGTIWCKGRFYYAKVNDGFAGNTVVEWNAYGHGKTGGYTSAVRVPWTLGASTTVVNANPLNFDATQSFTLVLVGRQWTTPPTFGSYIRKEYALPSATFQASGYALYSNPGNVVAGTTADGAIAVFPPTSTYTYGTQMVCGMIVDRSTNLSSTFLGSTITAGNNISAVGSVASERPLTISTASAGIDFELLAVAVIPKALTATDIATIVAAYQ